ncbi:MAG: transposase [Clostridia bacterium]|nr:transposase [Clostridia bacterium]MBQ4608829.1 transposase [Clostridia bacterium]MBQ6858669.1 transposase [Clostridia bacterium]MBQ7052912.1 transposase [Clostridia bacterium]
MNMDHPNRKPTRLRGFDYAQRRAYFITVCTKERREILAEICRGGALLLPLGEIVDREIRALPQKYDAAVDAYVIMPNHIHMILILRGDADASSVSDILCALKSVTTKNANRLDGCAGRQIWQRSFHDHIIRDERDYLKIWRYIEENPQRWEQDCFYRDAELKQATCNEK